MLPTVQSRLTLGTVAVCSSPGGPNCSRKAGWIVDLGAARSFLFYLFNQTSVCVSLNRYSNNMTSHSYIITFFVTCFILPLGVIFFCYGKLLRKLRKVSGGSSQHIQADRMTAMKTNDQILLLLTELAHNCQSDYSLSLDF